VSSLPREFCCCALPTRLNDLRIEQALDWTLSTGCGFNLKAQLYRRESSFLIPSSEVPACWEAKLAVQSYASLLIKSINGWILVHVKAFSGSIAILHGILSVGKSRTKWLYFVILSSKKC
jgi:hypothetical protein